MNVNFITAEYRPCKVKYQGKWEKAVFHKWTEVWDVILPDLASRGPGGQLVKTYGLVELENGQVLQVYPSNIIFEESKVKEYAYRMEKEATEQP